MESKEDKRNYSLEESAFYKKFLDLFENPETSVIEKALLKVDKDIRRAKENLGFIIIGFSIFLLLSVFVHIDYRVVIIIFLTFLIAGFIHIRIMNSRIEKQKFLLDLLTEARLRDFRKKYVGNNEKFDQ